MKSFKYTILILTTLLFSCGNNQKTDEKKLEKQLYDEVIEIHDEVMPKMSTILALERQLKEKIQELDSASPDETAKIELLKNQIPKLQEADEAMMQWMRNFQVNQEGWSHDSVMSSMGHEKDRITIVREKMLETITETEQLLKY